MQPIRAMCVVVTGLLLGSSFEGLHVLPRFRPHQPCRSTDRSQLLSKALSKVANEYCSSGTMPNCVLNSCWRGMSRLWVNGAQPVFGPVKHSSSAPLLREFQPAFFMDVFCVTSGAVSALRSSSEAHMSLTGEKSDEPPYTRPTRVHPPWGGPSVSGFRMSPFFLRIISQWVWKIKRACFCQAHVLPIRPELLKTRTARQTGGRANFSPASNVDPRWEFLRFWWRIVVISWCRWTPSGQKRRSPAGMRSEGSGSWARPSRSRSRRSNSWRRCRARSRSAHTWAGCLPGNQYGLCDWSDSGSD